MVISTSQFNNANKAKQDGLVGYKRTTESAKLRVRKLPCDVGHGAMGVNDLRVPILVEPSGSREFEGKARKKHR
jgi:hypothetical protein